MLELDAVTRRFDGNVAVDTVSFSVPEGQILGLIGPNGAGKTTLFNCVAGHLPPSSGRIVYGSRDVTRLPAHRRARLGIGRTFQIVRPFRSLTVREQVMVGAGVSAYRGLLPSLELRSRRHPIVEQVLDELHLLDVADRPSHQLPLGVQRRVEIARAEALSPRLLLLDEPGAGLSDAELAELADHVRSLRARGRTVILIEHSMDFALSTCDRIVVLVDGRVIAIGTPADIRRDPQVIAAYLGDA